MKIFLAVLIDEVKKIKNLSSLKSNCSPPHFGLLTATLITVDLLHGLKDKRGGSTRIADLDKSSSSEKKKQ